MFVRMLLILSLLISEVAMAQDMETGTIIEVSANGEYVQIYDKVFQVEMVVLDDGKGREVETARSRLREGDLVTVVLKDDKGGEFPVAEKLILYAGDKEKQVGNALEQDNRKHSPVQDPAPFRPGGTGVIIKEDGVWRN